MIKTRIMLRQWIVLLLLVNSLAIAVSMSEDSPKTQVKAKRLHLVSRTTPHHVIIEVDGIIMLVDPCSLPSISAPEPDLQDLARVQTCAAFASVNSSISPTCILHHLPLGTIAMHQLTTQCEQTRHHSFMRPDLRLDQVNVTSGPFDGALLLCDFALYLKYDITCQKSRCPDGMYSSNLLPGQEEYSEHSELWQCLPCLDRRMCDQGYKWQDCNVTGKGRCVRCHDGVPGKCHTCTHLLDSDGVSGNENHETEHVLRSVSHPCKWGFYKTCSLGRIARCEPCKNPVPANAEFSGSGDPEYSASTCPWKCTAGYFTNGSQCHRCPPAPNHAHHVTSLHHDGECLWQCDSGFEPALLDCQSDTTWTDKHLEPCSGYEKNVEWCSGADLFATRGQGSAKEKCCACGGGSECCCHLAVSVKQEYYTALTPVPVKQVCVQWCAFHVNLSQKLHTGLVGTNFQRYSTHQYHRRHGLQCQIAGARPSGFTPSPKTFQIETATCLLHV